MKMAELARRTGCSYSTINLLANEKTKRVDLAVIARICRALDCQPGDLLEYVPDDPA